jgi:hypothetical protein
VTDLKKVVDAVKALERRCDARLAKRSDADSWVPVRQETYNALQVGKSYKFDGRVGKVIEKAENSGQKSAVGLAMGGPMVKVKWKDESRT